MVNLSITDSPKNNASKSSAKSRDKSQSKSDQPLTLSSPKQCQGSYFEKCAAAFLCQKGLTLIAHNWQQPKVGELDLVMLEHGQSWSTVVFIEVRQRQRSNFGDAALSVTAAKQRKIIKTAKYFLLKHPKYADYDCRFDVIAYDVPKTTKHRLNDFTTDASNNVMDNHNDVPMPEWLIGAFIAKAW